MFMDCSHYIKTSYKIKRKGTPYKHGVSLANQLRNYNSEYIYYIMHEKR